MSITLDTIQYDFHSIAIKETTNGYELAIDSNGYITANINGSVTVSATDLDIRSLTHVSDSVSVGDGTDVLAIASDGSIAVTDNGGSLTVDGTVAATQSGTWNIGTVASITADVNISDGGNVISIDDAGGSLTVDGTVAATQSGTWTVTSTPDAYDAWQISNLSATSTAAEISATPLSGRLSMLISNLGAVDAYVGPDNTVTASTGIKIPKGSSFEYPFGETANVWTITASGTADIRVLEAAQ